jgi:membrane protease YdiL (CAAX protease family)
MNTNDRTFTTPVSPLRFFILTFSLSWLIWIPLMLSHFGIAFHIPESTSAIVRLLGVLMPAVSAIILTAASGEKAALRHLFARLTLWRVGWDWWVTAVLVFPALLAVIAVINNAFGLSRVSFVPTEISALVVNIIFLLIAVLGEEIGWHGVALPALQQKNSALISSIILAVCWGIWHLPFWLILDTFDQFGVLYLVMNLLFVVPTTFYVTWFFNRSKYSLLLPVAFHLTFNIVNTAILPVTLSLSAFGILIAVGWVIMILVLPHLDARGKP